MADIRQKIVIDAKAAINSLKQVAEGYDKVSDASDKTDKKVKSTSWRSIGGSLSSSFKSLAGNIGNAGNGLKVMASQTVKIGSGFKNLVVQAATFAASFIGVKKALELSDELAATNARLNSMNDGLQTTAELSDMVFKAAQNSRGSYADMASVVAKFGNNAKEAFSSSEEVVKFSELVQKQMTIAGASTQEASNAMTQLSQALGSGVLRGDELNSIFEQAPNLIRTIADYMGQPIGKVRELASEGKITADVVKNAILGSADSINAQFDAMPKTWSQALQSFKNEALNAFKPLLEGLNQLVNSKAFQEFQARITAIIGGLASAANQVMGAIVSITGGSVTTTTTAAPAATPAAPAEPAADDTAVTVAEEEAGAQEKVAKSKEKTAKATQKAAKAQKEYNEAVTGFDQINKLGGGSSGTEALGVESLPTDTSVSDITKGMEDIPELQANTADLASAMGDLTTTTEALQGTELPTNKFTDFFNQIKDMASDKNFNGIGELLGQKAQGLIHKIADGMNGTEAGATLASAANGVFSFIRETFEKPEDFKTIGEKFATNFNQFVYDFDEEGAGEAISNFILSQYNLLNGFIETADWEETGKSIVKFLENIKWGEIAGKACEFLGLALGGFGEFLGGIISQGIEDSFNYFKDTIDEFGGNIAIGIIEGIARIFDNTLGKMLDGFFGGLFKQMGTIDEFVPGWEPVKVKDYKMSDFFAGGGYPTTGQMFVARENGPELVGNIGGRTAVANNQQIVSAVSSGVASATERVMARYMNNNDHGGAEVPIYLDGEQIGTILEKSNRRRNVRNNPKLAFV